MLGFYPISAQPISALTPVSAGQVIAVGQVVETDLAQAIGWAPKARLVGQITEADLAQALTARKTKSVGQVTETDLGQVISSRKTKAIGQIAEVDLAQAVGRIKTAGVIQATETEFAQSVTRIKTRTIGQTTEADLAQTVTPSGPKIVAVGQVVETNAALAVTAQLSTQAVIVSLRGKPGRRRLWKKRDEERLAQAAARVEVELVRVLPETLDEDEAIALLLAA